MPSGQQFLFAPEKPLMKRLGKRFFQKIPRHAGVYKLRDARGKIVYVGNENLNRMQPSYHHHTSTRLKMPFYQLGWCGAALGLFAVLCFSTPAVGDDLTTIQNRLMKETSLTLVPIDTNYPTALAYTNPTGNEACLDTTQIPSQAQVNEAMTNFSNGFYTDIIYKDSSIGGSPPLNTISNDSITAVGKMAHFRRLLILALACNNAPTAYSQTSSLMSAAITNGLQAWVGMFPNNTVAMDDHTYYHMAYPNGYGAVVLLVPSLVHSNGVLWSNSITYLEQYINANNTSGANSTAPFRAALVGAVLDTNSNATAAFTAQFISQELNFKANNLSTGYTNEEGVQPDYSFVQHALYGRDIYWGSTTYGGGFIQSFTLLEPLTTGTAYSLDSRIPFVSDAVLNGWMWTIYKTRTDLSAAGRAYESYYSITAPIGIIGYLASIASSLGYTNQSTALTKSLNGIAGGTNVLGDRMFWRSDYQVHCKGSWFTSVRMSSTRALSCESDGSSAGMNNHYTGAGAIYLRQTGDEYYSIVSGYPNRVYSTNWNWRQLPGTTVEQYPASAPLPIHTWGAGGQGGTTFAGGASDGTYGAAGYIHSLADNADSQTINAYKAAFFFDNEYVMAGAGIVETNGTYPVVTTINQTRLMTNNPGGAAITYAVNGTPTNILLGNTNPISFPSGNSWVLHGNTGYVFPASGSTYSLNQLYTSGGTVPNGTDLFWLGISHGTNPAHGSYLCIVRPNSSATDLTNYVIGPDITIATNTVAIQAVFGPTNVFEGIYYTNGTVTGANWLRSLTVDQPCAVILRPDNAVHPTNLLLTVNNPQCESVNIPSVHVTLMTTYLLGASVPNPDGTCSLTTTVVLPTTNSVPGHAGQSVTTRLSAVTVVAGFTANPANGVVPVTVNLVDTSIAMGAITNRTWNFGDGNSTNTIATNLTHIYATGGYYTNVLTVQDSNGNSSYATGMVMVVVANPALTWQGDGTANTWDIQITPNWLYGGNSSVFYAGADVTFNDTGSNTPAINFTTALSPRSVLVNSTNSYTFSGVGQLTGAMSLTKSGTGTLTISNANTYTGATTVNAGTLNLAGNESGATNSLWVTNVANAATVNVQTNGVLVIGNGNAIQLGITNYGGSSAQALNVNGSVTNNGTLYVGRVGTVNVNPGGTWIQNGAMFIKSAGGYSANMNVLGGLFTYDGSSPMVLSPAAVQPIDVGTGILTIGGGTFTTGQGVSNNAGVNYRGYAQIVLTNGGALVLAADIPQFTMWVNTNSIPNIWLTNGGGVFNTAGHSTTISNLIGGSGQLTKLGAGTLTLSASNSFTGGTTISNGELWVNGYIGTGTVMVASGGTLGGVGRVEGTVTLNGMVAPGGGAIGTLNTSGETWTGGGAYQFSLNNATNSSGWDSLNVNGVLNLQSATNNPFTIKLVSLTSSNTPGPLVGFTSNGTNIWTLATVSGDIQNFNPAKFAVNTTGFSNAFTGTFTVSTNAGALLLTYTGVPLVAPSAGNVTLAGGTFGFTFSGPAGQSYHLYASTNLALPLTNWTILNGNIFGTGLINYTDTSMNYPQRYFRIGSP